MSDFHSKTTIKVTRKPHQCHHCLSAIAVGSPALRQAGMWDGDFFSNHMHPECEAASIAHRKLSRLMWDEWPWLHELEREDWPWLIAEHPVAAEHMGLQKRIEAREAA